jgi:hypothetical protein
MEPHQPQVVPSDHPLIGIPTSDEGVEYFTAERDAESAVTSDSANLALELLGAWSDLDWDAAVEQFDRIRHESRPTPPLDEI